MNEGFGSKIRFYLMTYPVYVFVGQETEDPLPVVIANEDDEICIPIFTDIDLAERHGNQEGWTLYYPLLKIDNDAELLFFLESRPQGEFSSIYTDTWKGTGLWRMSRVDMIRQLSENF